MKNLIINMTTLKINILDYGCGNLLSLKRSYEHLGFNSNISKDLKEILEGDVLILPGVGSFGNAMQSLKKLELIKTIKEFAETEKPILGICLGMQILLTEGYEFGKFDGLNLIPGKVEKIKDNLNPKMKLPHIGWNNIEVGSGMSKFISLYDKKKFYFVHNYFANTKNENDTIATCNYSGIRIAAIIQKKNIIGCQFHPEKSGEIGLQFLKSFCQNHKEL